jgi:hypothetical protein
MLKAFFIVFSLLLPLSLFSQTGSHYGGPGNQYGYRIKPTIDGGFIVGGVKDIDATTNAYWVMRFNNKGLPIWDSMYYSQTATCMLWSIIPTRDNGALLAGYSGPQTGNSEALMYKIDSVGRVVKKIEVDYAAADHAHWFNQLSNGNYYWTGHTDSKGDPNGDMIMQKLDSNFKLIWEKTYGYPNSMEHCHGAAITPDGGCILVGHTGNRESILAVKVNTNGDTLWQKIFSATPTSFDPIYDVVVTAEGNYALFATSDEGNGVSPFWLLVLDSLGHKVIDKHYANGNDFAFSGIQSSDSGYVMIGQTQAAGSSNSSLYALKTDKKGKLQWQRTFEELTYGYSVIQRGKQFILAGGTDNTDDNLDDLLIVVLDSAGNPTTLDTATVKDTVVAKTIALNDLKLNGISHLKQIGNDLPIIISWTQTGDLKTPVDVSVSIDSAKTWSKIQTATADANQITWANTPKTGYYPKSYIRISSTLKPTVFLQSDSFAIGTAGGVQMKLSNNELPVVNYPNPFSTSTIISFSLLKTEHVKLEIFNALGEEIATLFDRNETMGTHYIRFSRKDLSAGTYFYKLTTPEGMTMKQMVIQ